MAKKNKLFAARKAKLKKSDNSVQSSRKKIIVFILKFFLIFSLLNLLIEIANLNLLTNFIASVSSNALGLMVIGNAVLVNGSFFVVTNSCTGLVSASILAAIIFSLKKPTFGKKVLLFFCGLVIILVINIPRVMFVLFMAKNGFDAELIHEITWFFMSAIVLLVWYYGTKISLKGKNFNELI